MVRLQGAENVIRGVRGRCRRGDVRAEDKFSKVIVELDCSGSARQDDLRLGIKHLDAEVQVEGIRGWPDAGTSDPVLRLPERTT